MTQTTDRLAEVLDCDRDSAADWLHDSGSLTWEGAGRIRRGEESHSLVELLVRHRVAATQSLSTDLDKAQQRIAELEGALSKAVVWFDEYSVQHERKAAETPNVGETLDRLEKSKRNKARADELRAALSEYAGEG